MQFPCSVFLTLQNISSNYKNRLLSVFLRCLSTILHAIVMVHLFNGSVLIPMTREKTTTFVLRQFFLSWYFLDQTEDKERRQPKVSNTYSTSRHILIGQMFNSLFSIIVSFQLVRKAYGHNNERTRLEHRFQAMTIFLILGLTCRH